MIYISKGVLLLNCEMPVIIEGVDILKSIEDLKTHLEQNTKYAQDVNTRQKGAYNQFKKFIDFETKQREEIGAKLEEIEGKLGAIEDRLGGPTESNKQLKSSSVKL
jgi:DNA-binding transcriptional MerR regulator